MFFFCTGKCKNLHLYSYSRAEIELLERASIPYTASYVKLTGILNANALTDSVKSKTPDTRCKRKRLYENEAQSKGSSSKIICFCWPNIDIARHAGEGGRREQAPLLPFSWGSRGSKSALLKCNDLLSNC